MSKPCCDILFLQPEVQNFCSNYVPIKPAWPQVVQLSIHSFNENQLCLQRRVGPVNRRATE